MPARRPRPSAMMPTLLVAFGLAWGPSPDGARGDDAKANGVKISLVQPKPGPDGRLTLVTRAVIQGAIRIEGLDKERLPDVVIGASSSSRSDGVQAGEFVAMPKSANGDAAEYRVEIKAPPSPGQYRLKCIPSVFAATKKGAPGEAQYPGLDVTVVR